MNNLRADDVRVALPLFQEECGGSIPTSALQLHFEPIHHKTALALNEQWHSRMPRLSEWNVYTKHPSCYGAIHEGIYYAIAIWTTPISSQLDNGRNLELRRMAIHEDAPKNTASRMLGWMVRELKRNTKWDHAFSYQDTAVHQGTIYKASGWNPTHLCKKGGGWNTGGETRGVRRVVKSQPKSQSDAPKVRWEISLQNT